jgi:hypothetical protein
MKRFLIISALLLAGSFAGAVKGQEQAFPTMPAQLGGAGGAFKYGVTDGVRWAAWMHTRGTRLAVVCAVVDYEIEHPDTSILMTPISTARAYWAANVFADCKTDELLYPGFRAARAAFNLP